MVLSLIADPAPNAPIQIDWFNLSDATTVVRLIGIVIPLLTALVTKSVSSQGLKSLCTTLLSAITAAAAVLVTGDGGFDWHAFVNAFVNAFIPAIAVYYGLWKPTGVAGSVAGATQHFGIGGRGGPIVETTGKGAESPGDAPGKPHAGEGGAFEVGSLALLLTVMGGVLLAFGVALASAAGMLLGGPMLALGLVIGLVGGGREVA